MTRTKRKHTETYEAKKRIRADYFEFVMGSKIGPSILTYLSARDCETLARVSRKIYNACLSYALDTYRILMLNRGPMPKVPKKAHVLLPEELKRLDGCEDLRVELVSVAPKNKREWSDTQKWFTPWPESWPASVTRLSIFHWYSHPIKQMPPLHEGLTHLTIKSNAYEGIEHIDWPKSLTHLFLGEDCRNTVRQLPPWIKSLTLYDIPFLDVELPPSLTELTVAGAPNNFVSKLPPGLKTLKFRNVCADLTQIAPLPDLETLILEGVTPGGLSRVLPASLRSLNLRETCLSHICLELPQGLTELYLPRHSNIPVPSWPPSLERLVLGDGYNHPLNNLPDSVTYIRLGRNYCQPFTRWPPALTKLYGLPEAYACELPLALIQQLQVLSLHKNCKIDLVFPSSYVRPVSRFVHRKVPKRVTKRGYAEPDPYVRLLVNCLRYEVQ